MENLNKFYVVLGDWSEDGHGKHSKVLIESNICLEELQKAYKDSCAETKFDFHRIVCHRYEEYGLTAEIFDLFNDFHCPIETLGLERLDGRKLEEKITEDNCESYYFNEFSFINALMWFIGLSVKKEWVWRKIDLNIPFFNGYWSETLNVSFGYGLYEC
jgi:hypothetical protein